MKRLLIFLFLACPCSAARDFSGAWLHPNIPTAKEIELADPGQVNTFCAANLTCTLTAAWTFNGSPSLNLLPNSSTETFSFYGSNNAVPTLTNTPVPPLVNQTQFLQYCQPYTNTVDVGCGFRLNRFNNQNDQTNFWFRAPWNMGVSIVNDGLTANITSISRASNVVTVNTATQASLRPTGGNVNISGVTGCATSPNGQFTPATVVTATQFTFPQTGPNESCTPGTGQAFGDGRVEVIWQRNNASNNPIQTWMWENDIQGTKADQFGLVQLENGGCCTAIAWNVIVGANQGIGTTEQGFGNYNFSHYALLRANSTVSDAVNNVASFSLRNFGLNRETFIHGGGSNANGTWDVFFNSGRGATANGLWRFDLSGGGLLYTSASDGGAGVALQPVNGLLIPAAKALTISATGFLQVNEGTSPGASAGAAVCYADSTAHVLKCAYNNGTQFQMAQVITATSAAFATATTAGTCVQNTTAVTGAATTMAVSVSPVSTPGVGAVWSAFVSSAGNVTINECAVATSAGGTIAFNIRVTP